MVEGRRGRKNIKNKLLEPFCRSNSVACPGLLRSKNSERVYIFGIKTPPFLKKGLIWQIPTIPINTSVEAQYAVSLFFVARDFSLDIAANKQQYEVIQKDET